MDMMCVNLAVAECDTAIADKTPAGSDRLFEAVGLLKEMTHILVSVCILYYTACMRALACHNVLLNTIYKITRA
jgi:hypothetical protein